MRSTRKGPKASATKFGVGTRKRGNDGSMWVIKKISNGVNRWVKEREGVKNKKKNKKKTMKKTMKVKEMSLSLENLKNLKKKYRVTTTGSKKDIANGLMTVVGSAMNISDIRRLLPLLDRENKKIAEKLIKGAEEHPVVNYKGLWEPLPKVLSKMSREELIRRLQKFRNAWEKITRRNMDLDDERLKSESTDQLRKLIAFYYGDEARNIAAVWLRKVG
jgi:hypothetical protein